MGDVLGLPEQFIRCDAGAEPRRHGLLGLALPVVRKKAWLFWLVSAALATERLDGQMVHGRVIDADSNEGVSQALIEVLQNGNVVARAVADSSGAYRVSLPPRRSGSYRLRVSRIGFATQDSPALEVDRSDIVEVDLKLSPSAVPIDELMVEVGRSDLRHAATYEGLYARRARARLVGQERIVVAGDPELQNVSRVQEVLNFFFFGMTNSRRRCVDYYVNGVPRNATVLEIPADMVEGVEYYVDGRFAPFGLTPGGCSAGFRYSVVVVWLRRP